MASVIVASGQPVERAALSELVRAAGHQVTGEAESGQRALQLLREVEPELLVLATHLPKISGVEVLRRLRAKGTRTKILLYGEETAAHFIQSCYEAGADGFIGKQEEPGELRRAMNGVLTGHRYFPAFESEFAGTRKRVDSAGPLSVLSPRELSILTYLARGFPNIAIAQELSISEKTVSAHRSHLRRKLNAESLVELADIARKAGLLGESARAGIAPTETFQASEHDVSMLRAMLDGTPLPLHVRDLNGRLVACNDAFLKLHDTTFDAIAGTRFSDLPSIGAETAIELERRYRARVSLGTSARTDREVVMHGRRAMLHSWATPYRGTDGELLGMVVGTIDVTGREDMLRALSIERDNAAGVAEGMGRLLGALCDEMQPLAGLLETAAAMFDSGTATAEQRAFASRLSEAIPRVEHLTRNVKDLIALEQGEQALEQAPACPADLVREAAQAEQADARRYGCTLAVRVTGDATVSALLDRGRMINLARLLVRREMLQSPGCTVDIHLTVAPMVPGGAYRLTIDIEPSAGTAAPLPVVEAGNQVGFLVCRHMAEFMHGSLQLHAGARRGTTWRLVASAE